MVYLLDQQSHNFNKMWLNQIETIVIYHYYNLKFKPAAILFTGSNDYYLGIAILTWKLKMLINIQQTVISYKWTGKRTTGYLYMYKCCELASIKCQYMLYIYMYICSWCYKSIGSINSYGARSTHTLIARMNSFQTLPYYVIYN